MWSRQQPARVERPTPQDHTSGSADVALTPGGVQRLQRTVGNRAVGQLLRRARSPRAIQRVGGEKIGFDLPATTDPTIKAGQDLLLTEWQTVRQTEHDLKVGPEKVDVDTGAQELIAHRKRQKERDAYRASHGGASNTTLTAAGLPVVPAGRTGGQFTNYYYTILTGRNRTQQVTLLKTANAFVTTQLTVDDLTGVIQYRPDATQPYVTIGMLTRGAGAFTVKTAATPTSPNKRDILEKRGVATDLSSQAKEYVRDTRGVLTRRYAYVEKNYWQMMEFFMIGRHEGRFQSFMKAAGEPAPNLLEARQPEVDIVRRTPAVSTTGTLTMEQLAVAHQKLGSGPQQRGVSLASTPKVGVTYVNTGENFRTDRGFRLKVDLALIPPPPAGPLLINHYSHGGVSDSPGLYDTRRDRSSTSTYPYLASALHARELYLEYLRPEWVVAIESHPSAAAAGPTIDLTSPLGSAASLFALGKTQFGGAAFERGFDEGLGTDVNSSPADQNHTDGFNHARSFVRGWTAGNAKHTTDSGGDAAAAAGAHITVPQYVYDQSMAAPLPNGEYDIYRLGYLQGRAGVELIAAGANLPH